MTLKLNTFTGTWINEKLMRQKQNAEALKMLAFKDKLIDRVWGDATVYDNICEEKALMIEETILMTDDLEVMMSLVSQIEPEYDHLFMKHVYRGL